MGNLLSYSGIVTKIHAMQAKLLTDDHFREIAQLRNVAEVVTYLKKLPAYAKAFETVDENTLHRGDVEKILIQSLYNDYSKLYRFSGLEHQRFLRLYLKRYEVDLINYCLRIVYNWKARKKTLKGLELKIFTRDCGTKIDLINLQWIYRAKKYYNMDSIQIYAFIIPVYFHIKLPEIKTLIESESLDEFMELLRKTYYGRRQPLDDAFTIERMYTDCLSRLYSTDRREHPYSIASINSYLFQKEEELRKLTTALECIRYGLSAGETLKYIGGVRPQ